MQIANEINNVHDKIFRDILMDKVEMVELLNNVLKLKCKLKEEDIEKYSTNFITINYKNRQSDTIYKLKDKNILFLIEHQSKVDYSMPYRMLNYSIETIKSIVDERKIKTSKYKYPLVIPIVIYTGNYEWRVKTNISDISERIEGYEEKNINIEYRLIDISKYNKEILVNSSLLLYKVMAIEKCKTRGELLETLKKVVKSTNRESSKEKIERIIKYILMNELKNEEIKKFINELQNEEVEISMLHENLLKEEKMLISNGFKDGRKVGKREGILEGKIEAITEIIKNMIKIGEKEEKIQEYTGIPIEQIRRIKRKVEI